MSVVELKHPLVLHKLSILRDKNTSTKEFREIISELSTLLCYEALRDAKLEDVKVETPMCVMDGKKIIDDNYAFVPALKIGTNA